jgi:hypothetical protein
MLGFVHPWLEWEGYVKSSQVLLKALCSFEDLLFWSHAHKKTTMQHLSTSSPMQCFKAFQGTNLNNLIYHNYSLLQPSTMNKCLLVTNVLEFGVGCQ